MVAEPALALRRVHASLGVARSRRRVLHGVELELAAGQVLGVAGRSGSGKSTLGRVAVGLLRPDQGQVLVADGAGGVTNLAAGRRELRAQRPRLQMVFQDPWSSFPAWRTVGRTLELDARRLLVGADRGQRDTALARAWHDVELADRHGRRRPAELSGGQLQRAALARALLARPRVLVADEIVSALDLSTQDAVLALLAGLAARHRLAVLLVSHDLGVLAATCDRLLVLDDGRVVESGPVREVLTSRRAPATRALVDAVPRLPDSGAPGQ